MSSYKIPMVGTGQKHVRLVFISDTHLQHDRYIEHVPAGDVLIHTGDFCTKLRESHFLEFIQKIKEFFRHFAHPYKIFIGGNHEMAFNNHSREEIQSLLMPDCLYLQDTGVNIAGLNFYGSPWTSSSNMGFSASRSQLQQIFALIPTHTDILLTHLPPLQVLDLASTSHEDHSECPLCKQVHPFRSHWGGSSLFQEVVDRVQPVVHAFGHVHEQNGVAQYRNITFVNSAMDLVHKPRALDVAYDDSVERGGFLPVTDSHESLLAAMNTLATAAANKQSAADS